VPGEEKVSGRDRWRYGHAVALTAAAGLAFFCLAVHVVRREAFPAVVTGLITGDFAARARGAWREA
jgi:hypothetical protein